MEKQGKRRVTPETAILLGSALAVAAGMGLVSGVEWAASSGCFRSGMAWGGPVAGYLRSGALIGSIIVLFASLLMLLSASNKAKYLFALRLCWMSFGGLALVALSYPLAGLIECAAT